MIRKVGVPFFLLFLGCATAAPRDEVRVLVYNIHAGRDAARVDNLERVAELIRSTDADIVLLQEVDRGTRRSGGVDQLATLMRLTGRFGVFGKSLDYDGGEYGIATLARWPIVSHEIVPLRVEPPQARAGGAIEPRVALIVNVNTPRGVLRVLNTHLDASREETYRLQEVEPIVRAFRERPTLAGGDFNAEPASRVYARLREAGLRDSWIVCGEGNALTFPSREPVKRIDYLFLDSDGECSTATVLSSEASDHLPLLVAVVWPGE